MMAEESILIKKVKNSDENAFQKLFYNFYDILFRFVLYRINDEDIASDIAQETFFRVWKNRTSLVTNKSFFSLIARISTNLCYDYFRHKEVRRKNEHQVPKYGESHLYDPEKVNHAEFLEQEIRMIVNRKLSNKCRLIFMLSRFEGLSNLEIAEMLNISKRTVENQIYRALKKLKKHLKILNE